MAVSDVDPGTNRLVMAPALSDARCERCADLLACGGHADLDVLRVSYSTSPADLLAQWRDAHGDLPARTGIVRVGDRAALAGEADGVTDLDRVAVTAANPNDVTGLGMRLHDYLGDRDDDLRLAVCFDSITQMLQFADVEPVFQFLHTFTGQLREVGAVSHFHIDPAAHDAQTVSRLKPAFDDAVECEPE